MYSQWSESTYLWSSHSSHPAWWDECAFHWGVAVRVYQFEWESRFILKPVSIHQVWRRDIIHHWVVAMMFSPREPPKIRHTNIKFMFISQPNMLYNMLWNSIPIMHCHTDWLIGCLSLIVVLMLIAVLTYVKKRGKKHQVLKPHVNKTILEDLCVVQEIILISTECKSRLLSQKLIINKQTKKRTTDTFLSQKM